MPLEFSGSARPTIGVEIEIQIIDPVSFNLTPKAQLLLEKSCSMDSHRIKAEVHQSMIEIDTEIADSARECQKYLHARIHRLQKTAKALNLGLGIGGTHPFQKWPNLLISETDRYNKLHEKYQWLIRRLNVYGLHIHIGVKNGDLALAISNDLIQYLPHLLALSASSPYWQGIDTGMQSCRTNIMDSLPFSGIPPCFQSWSEFEHYHDTLRAAEAIYSLKDLYWLIRPNVNFGTLEFRVFDAMPTLQEISAVVALTQCLVAFTSNHIESTSSIRTCNREFQWIAPKNQWNAARDGLEASIITPAGQKQKISTAILELIQKLTPTAKNLDCLDELTYVKHMVTNGNNAQKQRTLFRKTQSLERVVEKAIIDFETIANSYIVS